MTGVAVSVASPADVAALRDLPGPLVVDVVSGPGGPGVATALAVAALGRGDVTVASFDWYALRAAREAGARTAFATPAGLALDAAVAYAVEAGHPACHPHVSAVLESPPSVARAHDAGVGVVAWDVAAAGWPALREIGCDGAIYTTTDSASGTLRNVTFSTSPR